MHGNNQNTPEALYLNTGYILLRVLSIRDELVKNPWRARIMSNRRRIASKITYKHVVIPARLTVFFIDDV